MQFDVIHTGQHYSYEMDAVFFEELEVEKPEYRLEVGSGTHAEQTARILVKVEEILTRLQPKLVLVQGDTNSTLGGALAAAKLNIKVTHVEAGLRSFDMRMPEEVNRKLVDHISDYLFAPTSISKSNLLREGIERSKVYVVGNTIVDAINQYSKVAKEKSQIIEDLHLVPKEYIVTTLHRQENVDNIERLKDIIYALGHLIREFGYKIVFPVHPRTLTRIKEFGIKLNDSIEAIKPLGFFDFLCLEENAKLVMTDSGGVQEECCILKVPCVTLRYNTERPETLKEGANILAGTKPTDILNAARKMLVVQPNWKNPFGDGKTSERIVKIILKELKQEY